MLLEERRAPTRESRFGNAGAVKSCGVAESILDSRASIVAMGQMQLASSGIARAYGFPGGGRGGWWVERQFFRRGEENVTRDEKGSAGGGSGKVGRTQPGWG
jgi:hypothetical protein